MNGRRFVDVVLLMFFILWMTAALSGTIFVYWGWIEEWFK